MTMERGAEELLAAALAQADDDEDAAALRAALAEVKQEREEEEAFFAGVRTRKELRGPSAEDEDASAGAVAAARAAAAKALEFADREGQGPRVYRCTQGVLFKKRSEDPTRGAIIRQAIKVGAYVHCTGRTWTGDKGGVWAELDAKLGNFGWVLVAGPGFGLSGPALVDPSGVDDLQHITIFLLDTKASGIIWETMVLKDASVADVKAALARATGLIRAHCCLAKDPPSVSPNGIRLGADYMPELGDKKTISELGFQGSGTIFLIYVGDLPADLQVRERAPPKLPHEEPPPLPGPAPGIR